MEQQKNIKRVAKNAREVEKVLKQIEALFEESTANGPTEGEWNSMVTGSFLSYIWQSSYF